MVWGLVFRGRLAFRVSGPYARTPKTLQVGPCSTASPPLPPDAKPRTFTPAIDFFVYIKPKYIYIYI